MVKGESAKDITPFTLWSSLSSHS